MSNDVRFGYNLGDEARRKLLSYWNIFDVFSRHMQKFDKPNFGKFTHRTSLR